MANAALARNGVDSDWVLRQTARIRRIYATEASHSPRSPPVAAAVASHAAPLWRQLAWFIMHCTYVPTYVIRAHKSLETLDTNNQGPMLVRPYIKLNAYESKGRGSKRTEAKKLLNCRVWSRYTPAMYVEASEALVPVGCRGAPTSRYLAATPVYIRQVSSDIWSYESSTNLSNDVTNHERRHNTVVIRVSRERAFTPEARHAVGLQGLLELDLSRAGPDSPGGMRLLEPGRIVALLRNHREYTPSITPRYTASEIWSRQATFWIGVEICQKSTPPGFSAKPLMPPTPPKKLLRRARCAGFQLGPRRFSPRIHVDSPATPGELAAADGPGPATAVDAASGSLLFPEHRNSQTESFSGLIVYCKVEDFHPDERGIAAGERPNPVPGDVSVPRAGSNDGLENGPCRSGIGGAPWGQRWLGCEEIRDQRRLQAVGTDEILDGGRPGPLRIPGSEVVSHRAGAARNQTYENPMEGVRTSRSGAYRRGPAVLVEARTSSSRACQVPYVAVRRHNCGATLSVEPNDLQKEGNRRAETSVSTISRYSLIFASGCEQDLGGAGSCPDAHRMGHRNHAGRRTATDARQRGAFRRHACKSGVSLTLMRLKPRKAYQKHPMDVIYGLRKSREAGVGVGGAASEYGQIGSKSGDEKTDLGERFTARRCGEESIVHLGAVPNRDEWMRPSQSDKRSGRVESKGRRFWAEEATAAHQKHPMDVIHGPREFREAGVGVGGAASEYSQIGSKSGDEKTDLGERFTARRARKQRVIWMFVPRQRLRGLRPRKCYQKHPMDVIHGPRESREAGVGLGGAASEYSQIGSKSGDEKTDLRERFTARSSKLRGLRPRKCYQKHPMDVIHGPRESREAGVGLGGAASEYSQIGSKSGDEKTDLGERFTARRARKQRVIWMFVPRQRLRGLRPRKCYQKHPMDVIHGPRESREAGVGLGGAASEYSQIGSKSGDEKTDLGERFTARRARKQRVIWMFVPRQRLRGLRPRKAHQKHPMDVIHGPRESREAGVGLGGAASEYSQIGSKSGDEKTDLGERFTARRCGEESIVHLGGVLNRDEWMRPSQSDKRSGRSNPKVGDFGQTRTAGTVSESLLDILYIVPAGPGSNE
ncbi:hypothetical protein C8R46DRAFT_1042099 [Mycena filopes]|nr:hypothetical protein C8R46DRAFT_1042099 [Mycena filopes]